MSKAGPVWNGQVRLNEEWLDQPPRWKRPRRIFVCAHGDLFAENVPDEWIDQVFAVMAQAPQHTFQVLTKRAKRMREYVDGDWSDPHYRSHARHAAGWLSNGRNILPNVCSASRPSVSRSRRAHPRAARHAGRPCASSAPSRCSGRSTFIRHCAMENRDRVPPADLLVDSTGSSSAANRRRAPRPHAPGLGPSHPRPCAAAQVPFFFKQWGAWIEGAKHFIAARPDRAAHTRSASASPAMAHVGKRRAGRLPRRRRAQRVSSSRSPHPEVPAPSKEARP